MFSVSKCSYNLRHLHEIPSVLLCEEVEFFHVPFARPANLMSHLKLYEMDGI